MQKTLDLTDLKQCLTIKTDNVWHYQFYEILMAFQGVVWTKGQVP